MLWVECCCCSVTQACLTLRDPMDCSPPDSSVHGIFQARILKWIVRPSSRGSSWHRETEICISWNWNLHLLWLLYCRQTLYHWATWEAWLKFQVPLKFICRISSSQCGGICRWSLWKLIRPSGHDCDQCPYRKRHKKYDVLLHQMRAQKKVSACETGRGLSH